MAVSVADRKAGAITETEEQAEVTSSEEVKTPVDGKVSSETPKTYTEKQLRDAVKAAEGRASKAEEYKKQVEEFKSRAEKAEREAKEATEAHEATKGRIEDLEADLEEAIGNDEGLVDINKIRKDLRAERDKLRQETKDERDAIAELKKAAEAERLEWAETVAEAQTFKFDSDLAKIVDEYEGDVTANFTKLKTTCEKAGIKTKEGAEAIAETFFTKKDEVPAILNDSGVNNGGSEDLNALSSRELLRRAYKRKK